jgi:subtilase family serine protease
MQHPARPILATAVAAVTLTALGALAVPAGASAAGPGPRRAGVPQTHPSWAVPARQVTAARPGAGPVRLRVYLAGRDPAGLAAYATAVSAPGTAVYRHHLTAAQANARYGTSAAQLAAVRAWLTGQGLAVTAAHDTGAAGTYLSARGSLAATGQAFRVTFHRYQAPGGHVYRAPDREASVPAGLAGDVLAVTGLDSAPHLASADLPPPGPNRFSAPPCSTYYGQKTATGQPRAYGIHQPWGICGYTPAQIRGAYHVTASGMTGRGQTVATLLWYSSPTIRADANRYARLTGDPVFRPGQFRVEQVGRYTHTQACNAADSYGEQALDVEAVHGMAPGADVRDIAAASCLQTDTVQALAYVVNRQVASIVTNSWSMLSSAASLAPVYNAVFQLGAAEGIGFYFSAGDSGYNAPGENPASSHVQVEFPASSPWVTAVGGTSLAIGRHNTYQWETSWGDMQVALSKNGRRWKPAPPGGFPGSYAYSGGGGVSTQYRQPAFQRGVVPARLATARPGGGTTPYPMRVVPDVAAIADPQTGMLVGRTTRLPDGRYGFTTGPVGGTSLASPVFAGIEADAQQAAGYAFGFADPAIYARYATPAFHDVTDHPLGSGALALVRSIYQRTGVRRGPVSTVLTTLGLNGEGAAALRAVRGYDDATGVGSPAGYIQSYLHP